MSETPPSKEEFLFPGTTYHGEFTPENLIFDANLQLFAQRVGYICALESSGKLPPADAYRQIRTLWRTLKQSHRDLGIDT
jgi:hypothetical protein